MPLSLSFFLTICATMWFVYGLLIKDFFIAVKFADSIKALTLFIYLTLAYTKSIYLIRKKIKNSSYLLSCFPFQAPNILGFIFGTAQMILYIIYKHSNKQVLPESMETTMETFNQMEDSTINGVDQPSESNV